MPFVPQDLRVDYGRGHLSEVEAAADPTTQFAGWFADAQSAAVPEANAFTLATVDASGTPSARVVLLKGFDAGGFTFFTNYGSRKARDLDANPRVAMVFFWEPLERQVRVEGAAGRLTRDESDAYFRSRPVASQIGAWASEQSAVIPSRAVIDERVAGVRRRFGDGPVPLPDFWGGYRVVPAVVEFWQGRPSRLHDRLRYSRDAAGAPWRIDRLSP